MWFVMFHSSGYFLRKVVWVGGGGGCQTPAKYIILGKEQSTGSKGMGLVLFLSTAIYSSGRVKGRGGVGGGSVHTHKCNDWCQVCFSILFNTFSRLGCKMYCMIV